MANKRPEMFLPEVKDSIFSTQETRDNQNKENVEEILLIDIVDFNNHPFQVKIDDDLRDMATSIKIQGVISPAVVRPIANGKYEMISGHRRKKASEMADLKSIPCLVKNLSDEEATIIMVDSNMQREKILPSERAYAYKMKLDAIKNQGKRTDLTSTTNVSKLRSDEAVGKEYGDSRETVRRYIRLTELIPELIELVDIERIALKPAVEISYLTNDEQKMLLDAIRCLDATPSYPQAIQLKYLSQSGKLTTEKIDNMLQSEKPNQIEKIKINRDRLYSILPKNIISDDEVENFLVKCVVEYNKRQKQKELSGR